MAPRRQVVPLYLAKEHGSPHKSQEALCTRNGRHLAPGGPSGFLQLASSGVP